MKTEDDNKYLLTPKEQVLLKLLQSDLNDCRNPKIIEKYPHLGDPAQIADLEKRIAELKETK